MPKKTSSVKPPPRSPWSLTTVRATAAQPFKRCSPTSTTPCCATSEPASSHHKPTASSNDSSAPSNTNTSTAATSATATPSTWKPTASASSTTPSDPTKHWQTGPQNRPTSQKRPPKTCQLLDSRHAPTDKFSSGELQVMPHDEGVGTFGVAGLWLVLALVLAASILVGAGSIWLAHRTLPEQIGEGHNGALSPFLTCVGLVYGALLGFTIVVAWEQFSSAEANVSNEASTLTTMYRQTVGMPGSEQARMRRLLRTYTSAVAGPEWEKAVRAGGGTEGARD